MEQFGIEQLKKALKFVGNFTNAIVKALEDDGKIKGTEYFTIAFTLPGLYPIVKNASAMVDEFNDLSKDEYTELCEYFKTEFDIPDDKVEAKVEKAFDLLLTIADQVMDIIEPEEEPVE